MILTNEKCYICGQMAEFSIENNATLLREAQCNYCKASIRNSDLAKILVKSILGKNASLLETFTEFKDLKIIEAQSSGLIHFFMKHLPQYEAFEYFDGIPVGQKHNGVICNNLESLSYESNTIDVIITQDVIEHVADPLKAFGEIQRVLKKGGSHIFTIPLHEGRTTQSRVGKMKVFHGDPIRQEGALVYTDWGDDIISIIESIGMNTEIFYEHIFYKPEEITNVDNDFLQYVLLSPVNYFKYNSVVLISQKV